MDPYNEQKQKNFLKKLLGSQSIAEEFCEKIAENKHWPFIDYGFGLLVSLFRTLS